MPLDPPLPCPCPSLATASAYPCTSLPLPHSSFAFSLCFSRCPREHLASFFGVNFTTPVHSFNCHSSHMHTTPPLLPSPLSPLLLSLSLHLLESLFVASCTVFNVTLSTYCFVCQTRAKVHMKILTKKTRTLQTEE